VKKINGGCNIKALVTKRMRKEGRQERSREKRR
jgi:hypothetical protein